MLFQDNEEGHVVIGEAVLQLALAQEEITVASLLAELRRMAVGVESDARRFELSEARNWLQGFIKPARAIQPVPNRQILGGLTEDKN